MKKIKMIGFAGLATGVLFFFAMQSAYAETLVPLDSIDSDTVWHKSGSPYVITGTVRVLPGATLTIREGVSIMGSTTPFVSARIEIAGGKLFMKGRGAERISVNKVAISVVDGYAEVVNTDMRGGNSLSFINSRARIATSTFSGMTDAIRSKESAVTIEGSRITGNTTGIRLQPRQVSLIAGELAPETGGLGNALDGSIPVANPSLGVIGTAIADNQISVANYSTYTVEAANNWWGTPNGPGYYGINRMNGPINFTPWLTSDPVLDPGPEEPECCSSILFLPGLQATRLYNSSEKLWEPYNDGDVRGLFLDSNGSSTDPTVYAGGPISGAYGAVRVYDSFFEFLDSLKKDGTVADWSVFGYDWRKPIDEVVAGRTKRATTTESLIERFIELASRSKTGKVTVVAHSNGGLVAKYLVRTLADMGKESLVDSMISVAVPYLGTPEAVLALLHGDGQEIGHGALESKITARQLGRNMPSAYSLLPSREYFTNIFSPTITFASTTVEGVNDGSYPLRIDSFDRQTSFIADTLNQRQVPQDKDVTAPIEGNQLLMAAADVIHSVIDPWNWPSVISRWGILGWNVVTNKGLEYRNEYKCRDAELLVGPHCEKELLLVHSASTTRMGDGTVVAPSAAYKAGNIVSVDLDTISYETLLRTFTHMNILEVPAVLDVIKKIILKKDQPLELPADASWGQPPYRKTRSLLVSTHSPVELHIYDSQGRHVGFRPAPVEGIEDDVVTFFDSEIPGSSFRTYGNETSPETYIHLPDNTGETYSVVMKGTDIGSARLQMERIYEDSTVESIEYYIPVSPLTLASTTVASGAPDGSFQLLASSTEPVRIDADGNGTEDAQVEQGRPYDPVLQLSLLRKLVFTLFGSSKRATDLDKRLAKLEDDLSKGKQNQKVESEDRTSKQKRPVEKLIRKVSHKKYDELTAADKEQIIGTIEYLVAQVE